MSSSRRVARNASVLLVGDIIAKVASLAFYIAIARALGQEGFGDFSFALAIAVILVTVSGMGLDALLAREVSRDRGRIEHVFWDTLVARLALGTAATAVATAIAWVGGYDAVVVASVLVLSLATLAEVLKKCLGSVFQGVEDMAPIAIGSIVQRFTTAILAVAALALGAGVLAVSIFYLLGAVLGLAYSAVAFRRRELSSPFRISRAAMRRLVIASIPLGLSGIFATVLYRLDSAILSVMEDNVAVGAYSAAYRLLDSTLFISFFLVAAMFPMLSRLDRTTKPRSAEVFGLCVKALCGALLPIGVCLVAFADPIVELLYGSEFADSASAVRLLGGAAVFYGLAHLSNWMLVAQDRERFLPWLVGGAALLNIALNVALIPSMSFDGAALATTLSEAALAIGITAFVLKGTGWVSPGRTLLGPTLGCVGMALTALLLGPSFASLAASLAAYTAILFVTERTLYPEDIRQISKAIVPARLSRSPASTPGS